MEYIIEAKKFMAKNDENEEVRNTDLDMAEWLLTRALAKRLVAQRLWPGLRTR